MATSAHTQRYKEISASVLESCSLVVLPLVAWLDLCGRDSSLTLILQRNASNGMKKLQKSFFFFCTSPLNFAKCWRNMLTYFSFRGWCIYDWSNAAYVTSVSHFSFRYTQKVTFLLYAGISSIFWTLCNSAGERGIMYEVYNSMLMVWYCLCLHFEYPFCFIAAKKSSPPNSPHHFTIHVLLSISILVATHRKLLFIVFVFYILYILFLTEREINATMCSEDYKCIHHSGWCCSESGQVSIAGKETLTPKNKNKNKNHFAIFNNYIGTTIGYGSFYAFIIAAAVVVQVCVSCCLLFLFTLIVRTLILFLCFSYFFVLFFLFILFYFVYYFKFFFFLYRSLCYLFWQPWQITLAIQKNCLWLQRILVPLLLCWCFLSVDQVYGGWYYLFFPLLLFPLLPFLLFSPFPLTRSIKLI